MFAGRKRSLQALSLTLAVPLLEQNKLIVHLTQQELTGCLSDELTTDNYMRATGCLSSLTFTRGKQHKQCKKTFDYREGSRICSCCLLLSSPANLKSYSWYNCTVLGVLLLCFRSYCSGWLGKICTSRQTSLSGFSSQDTLCLQEQNLGCSTSQMCHL